METASPGDLGLNAPFGRQLRTPADRVEIVSYEYAGAPQGFEIHLVPSSKSETMPSRTGDLLHSVGEASAGVAALLWPAIAILAISMLRTQLRDLISNLAARISDRDTNVKLGPVELSRRIDLLESKITSQADSGNVDRQVLVQVGEPSRHEFDSGAALQKLRVLAQQYANIRVADWRERVRAKDELAAMMGRLVIEEKIPRESLLGEKDEGIRLALATAINTAPEPTDAKWLLAASAGVTLKHVRYRFMTAFARLALLGYLDTAQVSRAIAITGEYEDGADAPLLTRIRGTRSILESMQGA